jgi:hypothetical protein
MRDLSKTKVIRQLETRNEIPLIQFRIGKRKAEYVCWMMERPYSMLRDNKSTYAPLDLRDIRMCELRKAAQQVGTYLEEDKVSQAIAEEVLDLIYAELNRRFSK